MSGHLVEGIADATAQAVAGAIRDAVLTLLRADGQHTASIQCDCFEARPDLQSSLWGNADEPDEPDEPWDDHEERPWSESPGHKPFPSLPTTVSAARPQVRSRLTALSAGWRAGRWCLRHRPGRSSLLASLGVGLAAGLGVLFLGSFIPAGAGLLGSALELASLAHLARSGATLLAAVAL